MTEVNEKLVTAHYTSYGVLDRIREALRAEGHDPDRVPPEVLSSMDEFHIGGAQATMAVLDRLSLGADDLLLDIGSGVGGPARQAARRFGCRVVGVDLTPDFVETARALSQMCGAGDRVRFEVGSATDLPLAAESVDAAMMLHVGMNIADKAGLMREVRRVLRPEGSFVVYDVMRMGEAGPTFPVPWAEQPSASALAPAEAYRDAAAAAGLKLEAEEDRRDAALGFFERIQAQAQSEAGGQPRMGLHTLLGPGVREKTANMIAALRSGVIAPVQMVFRAPATEGA
jgi:SAM-dependent methyltransferase